jgi:hypothetical protein
MTMGVPMGSAEAGIKPESVPPGLTRRISNNELSLMSQTN